MSSADGNFEWGIDCLNGMFRIIFYKPKTTIPFAINQVGLLSALQTTAKENIVAAINEIAGDAASSASFASAKSYLEVHWNELAAGAEFGFLICKTSNDYGSGIITNYFMLRPVYFRKDTSGFHYNFM